MSRRGRARMRTLWWRPSTGCTSQWHTAGSLYMYTYIYIHTYRYYTEYVPARHGMHAEALVAPVDGLYVPVAHGWKFTYVYTYIHIYIYMLYRIGAGAARRAGGSFGGAGRRVVRPSGTRLEVYIHIHMHVCMYGCMYIYDIYMYMYIYIYR